MILVTHPFLYYSLLAAAMAACLYLFVSVKCELARIDRKLSGQINSTKTEASRIGAQAASVEAKLGNWASRLRIFEDHLEIYSQGRAELPPRSGIDLNQRTQVMRRAKRGERPEQIAMELGIPKNEVELLVKVHRAVVRTF